MVEPTDDQHPTDSPAAGAVLRTAGTALGVLLVGYATLGRGFAYLHFPALGKLYVGEIVLGILVLSVLFSGRIIPRAARTGAGALLIAFMALGLARTLPFLEEYRIDALRDAVLYGYAIFALLVPELVSRRSQVQAIAAAFRNFAFLYVLWLPVVFLLQVHFRHLIPIVPGTDIRLMSLKGADMVVHTSAALAWFALVPLPAATCRKVHPVPDYRSMIWLAIAGGGAALTMNRAAIVSLVCTLVLVCIMGAASQVRRFAISLLLCLPFVISAGPVLVPDARRDLTFEGITKLVTSIVTTGDDSATGKGEATKQWRLNWWSMIAGETFLGEYFWNGRGFGVNLADAHGFQVFASASGNSLRSPHNSHMTVLSRMGVPGLFLWILAHGLLVLRFLHVRRLASDTGDTFLAGLMAWCVCAWASYVVNSSFDVYFEGPQGGIWFWSIMGFGLAASFLDPVADLPANGPA